MRSLVVKAVASSGLCVALLAGCPSPPVVHALDAGAGDAGMPAVDGGVLPSDAGTAAADAGPCNSGECDGGAGCSGTTIDGGCLMTLAVGQYGPAYVAVDTTSVYWTDTGGLVLKTSIGGGGVVTTLASGRDAPQGIAVDGAFVYWVDGLGDGLVLKTPIGGGAITTLVAGQFMQVPPNFPNCIAVDQGTVYFTEQGLGMDPTDPGGAIMSVPADGGTSEIIASGNFPQGIAVREGSVYWADQNTGEVMRTSVDGGLTVTLASASAEGGPQLVALDNSFVYWTDAQGGVSKVPLDGGEIRLLGEAPGGWGIGIAVDDESVYWANNTGDTILSVPVDGGEVVTLATGQDAPWGLAIDGTSVYWAAHSEPALGTGMVMELTPK